MVILFYIKLEIESLGEIFYNLILGENKRVKYFIEFWCYIVLFLLEERKKCYRKYKLVIFVCVWFKDLKKLLFVLMFYLNCDKFNYTIGFLIYNKYFFF